MTRVGRSGGPVVSNNGVPNAGEEELYYINSIQARVVGNF